MLACAAGLNALPKMQREFLMLFDKLRGIRFFVMAWHSRPKDGVASARLMSRPSTSFLPLR
jgi:hypothetical protein